MPAGQIAPLMGGHPIALEEESTVVAVMRASTTLPSQLIRHTVVVVIQFHMVVDVYLGLLPVGIRTAFPAGASSRVCQPFQKDASSIPSASGGAGC